MFNVDLSIRDRDGLGVVALRGELNLADAPAVASHLITAVAVCGPSVIVDLAGLEGIGYSGLAVLLRVRKWTRRNAGDLPLAAPQPPVRRILEATGLIDVFSVYRSVEEAASSALQGPPQAPAGPDPPRRPAAPVRLRPVRVPRCGAGRPVHRLAGHVPVRPLRGSRTCRSRRLVRDTCARWRSPLAITATRGPGRWWPVRLFSRRRAICRCRYGELTWPLRGKTALCSKLPDYVFVCPGPRRFFLAFCEPRLA
jgi:anti-sigma B factor antagonist